MKFLNLKNISCEYCKQEIVVTTKTSLGRLRVWDCNKEGFYWCCKSCKDNSGIRLIDNGP